MMLIALSTMLLTTACSSEDDLVNNTANTENTINKGYALPVTVNVTRQGDGATTRATFDGSKLNFSEGDKLFVSGYYDDWNKSFAGTLDYDAESGKFSGTIYTESPYEGTANDLFEAAVGENLTATLLPNGYDANGSNSFLSIDNKNTTEAYDDRLTVAYSKAFVASETAKATGVEQLSWEQAISNYNYSSGLTLSPRNAILNFTISGLAAGAQDVTLQIDNGTVYTVTGSVTPTSGVATFAIGVPVGANISSEENNLTVGSSNFTLPSNIEFDKGKIYNIARNAIPGALIGQFSVGMDGSTPIKVYFSKGNLQATYNGSTWTWAFAEHQYDYIGNAEGNTKVSVSDPFVTDYTGSSTTVDLFGWSTSTTYLGIHNSDENDDYYGGFFNWGSHEDVTAGIGSGWRTLSNDEWLYLFYSRSDAAEKYGFATVNGVHGIIILPDAFVDPNKNDGSKAFVGSTIDWDANLYTAENWALMEKNGAVFLPAAGYRSGSGVNYAGSDGYYWSSSYYEEPGYAHNVYFDSDDLTVDDYDSRYFGHSVRLVRPVQ